MGPSVCCVAQAIDTSAERVVVFKGWQTFAAPTRRHNAPAENLFPRRAYRGASVYDSARRPSWAPTRAARCLNIPVSCHCHQLAAGQLSVERFRGTRRRGNEGPVCRHEIRFSRGVELAAGAQTTSDSQSHNQLQVFRLALVPDLGAWPRPSRCRAWPPPAAEPRAIK